MKKASYIIIKDNLRRHPEKRIFTNSELAHNYFMSLIEDGFYPVCYIKSAGLFGKTRRANWDRVYYGEKLEEKRREFFNRSVMSH